MSNLPKTGSNTKKHHYIPVGYLRRFATPEKRQGHFFCIDKVSKKQFKTSPNNACEENDFNRVDIPGVHPNALEDTLGQTLEADLASVLQYIHTHHSLPKNPSKYFDTLMMAIALFTSRNPAMRKQREGFDYELDHALLEMAVSTPEYWGNIVNKMKKEGYPLPQRVSYEEMHSLVKNKEYKRSIPHGYHIPTELDSVPTLFPYLVKRKWQLFIAPKDESFICSDKPVVLATCTPELLGKPLGYGLPSTIVLFPLSPKLCITGAYEQKAQTIRVNAYAVAEINGFIVRHSHRFIYSQKEHFSYYNHKNELRTSTDLYSMQMT